MRAPQKRTTRAPAANAARHVLIICMDTGCNHLYEAMRGVLPDDVRISVKGHADDDIMQFIETEAVTAIVLSGSVFRVRDDLIRPDERILTCGVPILGICYGWQWLAYRLGGDIGTFRRDKFRAYVKESPILQPFAVPTKRYAFVHHDFVTRSPKGWTSVWTSKEDRVWMAYHARRKHVGVQFHPERRTASAVAFFHAWIDWVHA